MTQMDLLQEQEEEVELFLVALQRDTAAELTAAASALQHCGTENSNSSTAAEEGFELHKVERETNEETKEPAWLLHCV